MATLTVYTTAEDGDIHGSAGIADTVNKTATTNSVYVSSSTATDEKRAFWFFDTSALGAGATVTACDFHVYVSGAFDDGFSGLAWYAAKALLGSTLDIGDWGVIDTFGSGNIFAAGGFLGTGWNTLSVPTKYVNKTGYTNVEAAGFPGSSSTSFNTFHTYENASGNKAYLVITYTPAATNTPSTMLLMGVG